MAKSIRIFLLGTISLIILVALILLATRSRPGEFTNDAVSPAVVVPTEEAGVASSDGLRQLNDSFFLFIRKHLWSADTLSGKPILRGRHPPAKTSDDVKIALDQLVYHPPASPIDEAWHRAEFDLLQRHRNDISKLMGQFGLVGRELTYFLHDDGLPIHFVVFEGSPCLVLADIGIDRTYNLKTTSAKERAADVATTCMLPELEAFARYAPKSIPWYGIGILYGCNQPDSVTLNPVEVLLMIVSREDCVRFMEAAITQEQLLERATFFQSDVDMGLGGKAKRIEISLP